MAKTNFYIGYRDLSGIILENEIYFNKSIDDIQGMINELRIKYSEYDFLEFETTRDSNEYILYGYIKGRND